MSTSGYYGGDDDDGNAQPISQPYTLTSHNYRPEPTASGSHTSSIAKVPVVDSNPFHKGPFEVSSDYPRAKPLPNENERVRDVLHPVERNAGIDDLKKKGGVGVERGIEMSAMQKDDTFYMESLFLQVGLPSQGLVLLLT